METIVPFRPPSTEIERCTGKEGRGLWVLMGNVVRLRRSSNCPQEVRGKENTLRFNSFSGLGYRDSLGQTISRGRGKKKPKRRSVIMKLSLNSSETGKNLELKNSRDIVIRPA